MVTDNDDDEQPHAKNSEGKKARLREAEARLSEHQDFGAPLVEEGTNACLYFCLSELF